MYLLDTNVVSNVLDTDRGEYERLREKVRIEQSSVAISIITIEEQIIKGVLPLLKECRDSERGLVEAYAFFQDLLDKLAQFDVLPFDSDAERAYFNIPPEVRRNRKHDCRIAAVAISRGLTVVTSNIKDFKLIPNVDYVEWGLLDPDEVPPPDWYKPDEPSPW